MAAPLLAFAAAALQAAAAAAHAGALLFGPRVRAWAMLRAAASTVAGIARDAALLQDPPWPGGGCGCGGALRCGRHARGSGGTRYQPTGSAGLVDLLRGLCALAACGAARA
jgi:hypothetical protein